MSKKVKAGLLDAIAFMAALLIPVGTIIANFRQVFPEGLKWYEKAGLSIGAISLIIIISVMTFWKFISPRIKYNPDLWSVNLLLGWVALGGAMFLIYSVINQLAAVVISGIIGAAVACIFNAAAYCIKHYGKE